jgi:pyruvate/2-oxoglutarate/acetoin dehydrogenase E1 component
MLLNGINTKGSTLIMAQANTSYSEYHKEIVKQMGLLASKNNAIFLGQQITDGDFYGTLANVPINKRIEFPIAEEMQAGVSIGLALEGFLPICIYQRCDFMYRAFDQIYNHLAMFKELTDGRYDPKVIIRTTIGSDNPLDPGIQHTQNIVPVLRASLSIPIIHCNTIEELRNAYFFALTGKKSVIIVERQGLYYDKK